VTNPHIVRYIPHTPFGVSPLPNLASPCYTGNRILHKRHLGMKVAAVTVQAQLEPLAGMEIRHRSRAARRVLR
jgi:hypothetical protein